MEENDDIEKPTFEVAIALLILTTKIENAKDLRQY